MNQDETEQNSQQAQQGYTGELTIPLSTENSSVNNIIKYSFDIGTMKNLQQQIQWHLKKANFLVDVGCGTTQSLAEDDDGFQQNISAGFGGEVEEDCLSENQGCSKNSQCKKSEESFVEKVLTENQVFTKNLQNGEIFVEEVDEGLPENQVCTKSSLREGQSPQFLGQFSGQFVQDQQQNQIQDHQLSEKNLQEQEEIIDNWQVLDEKFENNSNFDNDFYNDLVNMLTGTDQDSVNLNLDQKQQSNQCEILRESSASTPQVENPESKNLICADQISKNSKSSVQNEIFSDNQISTNYYQKCDLNIQHSTGQTRDQNEQNMVFDEQNIFSGEQIRGCCVDNGAVDKDLNLKNSNSKESGVFKMQDSGNNSEIDEVLNQLLATNPNNTNFKYVQSVQNFTPEEQKQIIQDFAQQDFPQVWSSQGNEEQIIQHQNFQSVSTSSNNSDQNPKSEIFQGPSSSQLSLRSRFFQSRSAENPQDGIVSVGLRRGGSYSNQNFGSYSSQQQISRGRKQQYISRLSKNLSKESDPTMGFKLGKRINWKQYTLYGVAKGEFDYWRTIGRNELRGYNYRQNYQLTHTQQVFNICASSKKKVLQTMSEDKFLEAMGQVMNYSGKDEVLGPLNLTSKGLNLKVMENVKVLQFKQCDVMQRGTRLSKMHKVMEKYSTSASVLDLSNLAPDLTDKHLQEMLNRRMAVSSRGYREVLELHLRNCFRLQGSRVSQWAKMNLTSVRVLDISGCWLMNHEGIVSLCNEGVLPRVFIYRDSYITKDTLLFIASQNTNLVELDISNPRNLGGTDLEVLSEASKNLQVLRVQSRKQQFTLDSLECLKNLKNLRILDLPKIVFDDEELKDEYTNRVVELMQRLPNLEAISLMEAFQGFKGRMLPENLKKFSVSSDYCNLLQDVLQDKVCFWQLQSLTIPPTYLKGELSQVGSLPQLRELKFFSQKSMYVDWRCIASVICMAPALQKICFQNCQLEEWECGLGYDSFRSVEEVELINCPMQQDQGFQHLYSIFLGMKKMKLQDMSLPNNFFDNLPDSLEFLDLYFVQNVDQERIISMRGCKPVITHSYRQQDLPPNYRQLQKLESLVVRQQGLYMRYDEQKQVINQYHIQPLRNLFITGLMCSLGPSLDFRGPYIDWMVGNIILRRTQQQHSSYYYHSFDPLLSNVERSVLETRRSHVRYLRTHVNLPREHLEYLIRYHNM